MLRHVAKRNIPEALLCLNLPPIQLPSITRLFIHIFVCRFCLRDVDMFRETIARAIFELVKIAEETVGEELSCTREAFIYD